MTPEMDEFGQEKATHYYVNDIENFTLLVAHAVYGQQTTVTESNVCMVTINYHSFYICEMN